MKYELLGMAIKFDCMEKELHIIGKEQGSVNRSRD